MTESGGRKKETLRKPSLSDERQTLRKPSPNPTLSPDDACEKSAAVASASEADIPEVWSLGDVILDTYEVKAELGAGAFGTVHKVHHKGWNTDLAVKSAKVPFDEEAIKREAEVWMELGLHPNIVSCFFVRNLGGIPRIFVECVEGGSLDQWLYGKKERDEVGNEGQTTPPRELSRAQRLAIAIGICRGIDHAHTFQWKDKDGNEHEGFIHRDLKPANILMTSEGIPRVTDFGLVHLGTRSRRRAVDSSAVREAVPSETDGATLVKSIREEGGFEGTPAYASPEQWESRGAVSKSADIYAFGVILYELFCGRRPFELADEYRHAMPEFQVAELERMHREQIPADPHGTDPELDIELTQLILKCLAKRPDARPPDFAQVRDQLKAIYQRIGDRDYDSLSPEPKAAKLLADSLNNKALSFLELGMESEAEALWQQTLQLDAHHIEATYNAGLHEWRSARIPDEKLVRRMEETRKSHKGEWQDEYLLGLIHLERGDGEAAAAVLEEAAKVSGNEPDVIATLERARALGPSRVRTFEEQTPRVICVSLSEDGRWAMTGSEDARRREYKLRLWEVSTGSCIRIFEGHTKPLLSVALSADGRWALSGSQDDTLRLWEVSTGRCIRSFEEHRKPLSSAALSADGRWALSTSLRLWEVSTGRCARTFELPRASVHCVCLNADGRWALSGSTDGRVRLWDTATGRCVRTLKGHSGNVKLVCVSWDGRWALSGSDDETLRLWEVGTGSCVRIFRGNTGCLSGDGRWALSLCGGTLVLWEVATGRCVRCFEGHKWPVSMSEDGRCVLSGSKDGMPQLRELPTPVNAPFAFCRVVAARDALENEDEFSRLMQNARRALEEGHVSNAHMSAAKARALPGRLRDDHVLDVWNRLKHRTRSTGFLAGWHVRTFQGSRIGEITCVCLSGDGRWAMASSGDTRNSDRKLRLWDISTGCCVRTFEGHVDPISSVCLSGDGRWALSGSGIKLSKNRDWTVRLWELSTGRSFLTLVGHTDRVNSVCVTRDGRWVLSASDDKTLRLWKVSTGRCVRTFDGHAKGVTFGFLSGDGRWALSGSYDSTLRLWEVSTGRCVRSFEGHVDWVRCGCLSWDGRWALSGSADKTLRLWDASTGRAMRTFEGHTDWVASVALSGDGRWAVSGSHDSTLRLWEVLTGRCVHTFEGHTNVVTSVCLSGDGRWVLSGSRDRTLRLWELDWELETVEPIDWDEDARPYLDIFLTLHTPYAGSLPAEGTPSEKEVERALSRDGKPTWTDDDFQQLLYTLGCAGYGWLRPEGVKSELEKMAAECNAPPRLDEPETEPITKPEASGQVIKSEAPVKECESATHLLEEAQKALLDGRYEAALRLTDRVLEMESRHLDANLRWTWRSPRMEPTSLDAHNLKARSLAGLKRWDEALSSHDEAINGDPRHAPYVYSKGLTLSERGDRRGAKQLMTKCFSLDPNFAQARVLYQNSSEFDSRAAVALIEEGRLDEVLRLADSTLVIDPEDAWANNAMAYCLRMQWDLSGGPVQEGVAAVDDVLQHLETALLQDPRNPWFLFNKVEALGVIDGRFDECVRCAYHLREIAPDHPGLSDFLKLIS